MPLCYYLLVRIARIIPVDPHLMLRMPSIFGYLLTLLGVYWFARNRDAVLTVARRRLVRRWRFLSTPT
jgi:hypothetical protein